jgi:hypothetical protein
VTGQWSTLIPIGKATSDGRIIAALRLEPSRFPLNLMILRLTNPEGGHADAGHIGRVLWADVESGGLRLAGDHFVTYHPTGTWYAAPDLTNVTALQFHTLLLRRQRMQMTGTLLAITLVARPPWRGQASVEFR